MTLRCCLSDLKGTCPTRYRLDLVWALPYLSGMIQTLRDFGLRRKKKLNLLPDSFKNIPSSFRTNVT